MNDIHKKRGRKPREMAVDDFLNQVTALSFVPSRLTREHMIYGMRETGIHNRSQYIAWALKTAHDFLVTEGLRREKLLANELEDTI